MTFTAFDIQVALFLVAAGLEVAVNRRMVRLAARMRREGRDAEEAGAATDGLRSQGGAA